MGDVPVEHVGYHFDFCFRGGDFLGGGELGSGAEEKGHCCGWEGWMFGDFV